MKSFKFSTIPKELGESILRHVQPEDLLNLLQINRFLRGHVLKNGIFGERIDGISIIEEVTDWLYTEYIITLQIKGDSTVQFIVNSHLEKMDDKWIRKGDLSFDFAFPKMCSKFIDLGPITFYDQRIIWSWIFQKIRLFFPRLSLIKQLQIPKSNRDFLFKGFGHKCLFDLIHVFKCAIIDKDFFISDFS